jgi:hypothetical protein
MLCVFDLFSNFELTRPGGFFIEPLEPIMIFSGPFLVSRTGDEGLS